MCCMTGKNVGSQLATEVIAGWRILPYRNHLGIRIFARNFFGGMKLSRDKDRNWPSN
jgi:hypothetical protein